MTSVCNILSRKPPLLPIERAGNSMLIAGDGGIAMAKTRQGSGPPMSQNPPEVEDGTVIELPLRPRPRKSRPSGPPRFRIFIIDSGWNSVARKVLRHNFALVPPIAQGRPNLSLEQEEIARFDPSPPVPDWS